MKQIKFRQEIKPECDKLNEVYHYWGYIDGGFTCPVGNNISTGQTEQFTGKLDGNGDEIYE
jgi:hypothetical protein